MQAYELAFIVNPDLSEEKREKEVSNVKSLLEKSKAEVGELEVWGKRDFSFPINKQTSGVYYLQYFQTDPNRVQEIDAKLKLEANVLRFLLVKHEKRKVKINRKARNRRPFTKPME